MVKNNHTPENIEIWSCVPFLFDVALCRLYWGSDYSHRHANPLFTHCRNSKYPPYLLTSGLNRTPVYAAASIKQCLIQKIMAGCHWVELIWY